MDGMLSGVANHKGSDCTFVIGDNSTRRVNTHAIRIYSDSDPIARVSKAPGMIVKDIVIQ